MTAVLVAFIVCTAAVLIAHTYRPREPVPPPTFPAPAPSPVAASVLDERLLDYVLVTLKSGTTFGGVLYVEDMGAVVLAKAEQIGSDGSKTRADGEIILLRGDIDFIQRP